MSSRSELWKHFDKLNKASAKCNRCLKTYKISGNTTNLWSHLEKKHNVQKPSSRPAAAANSRGDRDQGPAHVGDDQEEDNAVRDEVFSEVENVTPASEGMPAGAGSSSGRGRSPAAPKRASSGTTEPTRPKQLRLDESYERANSFRDGGAKHAEILDATLYMICKDKMPFATTERAGFKRFAKAAVPLWSPPSRQTVTRLVEKKFTVLQGMTRDILSQQEAICLTADNWTETLSTSAYLGVTAHYAVGTDMESCVLGLERLTQSHTGLYLADRLKHMCDEWHIDRSKVNLIVTDNAENIRLAVKTVFGADRTQPCFAHTLNLIPQAGLGKRRERNVEVENVPGVPALLKKVKDIVSFAHKSVNFSDQLIAAQIAGGKSEGTCLRLLQEVSTRWGSAFLMIERFLLLTPIIGGVAIQFPDLTMLSGNEIVTLRAIMVILRPFHIATKEISGEKYTTASRVIPIVHVLIKKTRAAPSPDDLSARFKAFCLAELERRFQPVEFVKVLATSTILDPRYKKPYFNNQAAFSAALSDIGKEVKAMMTTEANKAAEAEQELQEAAAARLDTASDDLWGEHDVLVARSIAASSDDISGPAMPPELKQYLSKPLLSSKVNPLEAWEGMKLEFPHLYIIAKRYLCSLATSVPSERMFSDAGNIATDQRSRLTSMHLSELLFLSSVSDKLWDKATTN